MYLEYPDSNLDGKKYKHHLNLHRKESIGECFSDADLAMKENRSDFVLEEEKAFYNYSIKTQQKALEDARKKTPGAKQAWNYLLSL
jgi:hypothetical protein